MSRALMCCAPVKAPGAKSHGSRSNFCQYRGSPYVEGACASPSNYYNNSRAKRSRPREYFANVRIAHEPLIPAQALGQKTLEKT